LQIKARPLAKSLNKTAIDNDMIMGKTIQLTLGRSKIEWERANCGIFLYWHGRLIEVSICPFGKLSKCLIADPLNIF
jgi:hypothetical protein